MRPLFLILMVMSSLSVAGIAQTPPSKRAMSEAKRNETIPLPSPAVQKEVVQLSKRYLQLWKEEKYTEMRKLLSHKVDYYTNWDKFTAKLLPRQRKLPLFQAIAKETPADFKPVTISRKVWVWTLYLSFTEEATARLTPKDVAKTEFTYRLMATSFRIKEGIYLLAWYKDDDKQWRCLHNPFDMDPKLVHSLETEDFLDPKKKL